MPTAERMIYADSSALVKLVISERWSTDLAVFLNAEADLLVSSALSEVEVVRGVRVADGGLEAEEEALELLDSCTLIDVDEAILEDARRLSGPSLGTLDAIHTASAVRSGAPTLVTYDRQLGRAARSLGLRVEAPGAV